jgi:predicted nucleic-acid-binding Zn-ribbon protein
MSLDAIAQPMPSAGEEDVTSAVIADLQARSEAGEKKYGTRLKTFNGRTALVDAYQEALDLSVYLKQKLLEESGSSGEASIKAQCPKCGGVKFSVQEYIVHSGEVEDGVLHVKQRDNGLSLIECANEHCKADCTDLAEHFTINFC